MSDRKQLAAILLSVMFHHFVDSSAGDRKLHAFVLLCVCAEKTALSSLPSLVTMSKLTV